MRTHDNALPFDNNLFDCIFNYLDEKSIQSFALTSKVHAQKIAKSHVIKVKKLEHTAQIFQNYFDDMKPSWQEKIFRYLSLIYPPHVPLYNEKINYQQWEKNLNTLYNKLIKFHVTKNNHFIHKVTHNEDIHTMSDIVYVNPSACKKVDLRLSRFSFFNKQLPPGIIKNKMDTDHIFSEEKIDDLYRWMPSRGTFVAATAGVIAFVAMQIISAIAPRCQNYLYQVEPCVLPYRNTIKAIRTTMERALQTDNYFIGIYILGLVLLGTLLFVSDLVGSKAEKKARNTSKTVDAFNKTMNDESEPSLMNTFK